VLAEEQPDLLELLAAEVHFLAVKLSLIDLRLPVDRLWRAHPSVDLLAALGVVRVAEERVSSVVKVSAQNGVRHATHPSGPWRSPRNSADFCPGGLRLRFKVTTREDIALVAGQLANLTRTVAEMETRIRTLYERAENQQERADQQRERTEIQQERIDLAARELAEVSARLQAAADALRASI